MVVDHQHAEPLASRLPTRPASAPRPAAAAPSSGESAGAAFSVSVTVKVEPLPGVLSMSTVPSISSVSRRTIERPSPVPPNFRVVEESACANGWNRRARCSSLSPMPVSRTASVTRVAPSPSGCVAGTHLDAAALGELQRVADAG